MNDNLLKPVWFEGPAIPDSLFTDGSDNVDEVMVKDDSESGLEAEGINDMENDSDGEAWSEDSDSEEDDGNCLFD